MHTTTDQQTPPADSTNADEQTIPPQDIIQPPFTQEQMDYARQLCETELSDQFSGLSDLLKTGEGEKPQTNAERASRNAARPIYSLVMAHVRDVDYKTSEAFRKRKQAEEHAAAIRRRADRMIDRMEDSAGWQLAYELNIGHADFDRAAFVSALRQDAKTNGNIVLYGAPGTGKSRALLYLAQRQFRKYPQRFDDAEWITGSDFAELVSALGSDDRQSAKEKLKSLAETGLLLFDDLGGAKFTDARTSQLFAIMDARYKHDRRTYITTNFSDAKLQEMMSVDGDEVTGERIMRRIRGTKSEPLAVCVEFKRQNGKRAGKPRANRGEVRSRATAQIPPEMIPESVPQGRNLTPLKL